MLENTPEDEFGKDEKLPEGHGTTIATEAFGGERLLSKIKDAIISPLGNAISKDTEGPQDKIGLKSKVTEFIEIIKLAITNSFKN